MVDLFIVYELDTWSRDLDTYFTLKDCLGGSAKITKNDDRDKYKHSNYGIGFDSRLRIFIYRWKCKKKCHYFWIHAVKLGTCSGSCNTLNDLSNRVYVPNKTKLFNILNIHVFNMIRRKSESEILAKDISCKCKCRSNGKQCNSNQWWNNDKYLCECKKQHACEKNYI